MSISQGELVAPGFLDPSWTGLARELAQDIRPVEDILKDYGFTGPDDVTWLALMEQRSFGEAVAAAAKEWNAADSTPKRIRVKAQASLEMVLPDLHAMALNNPSVQAKLDAMKLIKSLAGFDHNGGVGGAAIVGDGGGSGFSITINVAGQSTHVRVENRAPMIEGVVDGVVEGEDGREKTSSIGDDST